MDCLGEKAPKAVDKIDSGKLVGVNLSPLQKRQKDKKDKKSEDKTQKDVTAQVKKEMEQKRKKEEEAEKKKKAQAKKGQKDNANKAQQEGEAEESEGEEEEKPKEKDLGKYADVIKKAKETPKIEYEKIVTQINLADDSHMPLVDDQPISLGDIAQRTFFEIIEIESPCFPPEIRMLGGKDGYDLQIKGKKLAPRFKALEVVKAGYLSFMKKAKQGPKKAHYKPKAAFHWHNQNNDKAY